MSVVEKGSLVGPVEVGPVAHGGHCVARHDRRVIFVRHALPGERVMVRLTDLSHARFWRGDAVEILEASTDRRPPPCPAFHPGGCGGCDLQHATEEAQRELKRRVVAEQLARLGGVDWTGAVEAVEPVWGWRTRMRYSAGKGGLGLRAHRSHEVVALPDQGCAIARTDPRDRDLVGEVFGEEWLVVTDADGVHAGTPASRQVVREEAAGRSFDLALTGFWQVHPQAASTLVAAVVEALEPQAGERAFDLYCGVGLFAAALADRDVRVWGVESSQSAVGFARRNVPQARFSVGRVERALARLPQRTDLVVLDPPRSGAGQAVLEQITRRQPRSVAYVACDPAALGRDVGYARQLGWEVTGVRAFDLFPQTHHIECVAHLRRGHGDRS